MLPGSPSAPQDRDSKNYVKEWEKCMDVIDKFDKTLLDLRKYGFSFLTGLITASSFVGISDVSNHNTIQIAVIVVTMILVVVLYWLDIYYQNVLTGAVLRSQFLGLFRLDMRLSSYISSYYSNSGIGSMLHWLYLGFLVGLFVLGLYVLGVVNLMGISGIPLLITLLISSCVIIGIWLIWDKMRYSKYQIVTKKIWNLKRAQTDGDEAEVQITDILNEWKIDHKYRAIVILSLIAGALIIYLVIDELSLTPSDFVRLLEGDRFSSIELLVMGDNTLPGNEGPFLGSSNLVMLSTVKRQLEQPIKLEMLDLSNRLNLAGADLSSVMILHSNLSNATLKNSNLKNANLTNADLRSADLTNAFLLNTDLTNADLRSADLTNSDVTRANLQGSLFDCESIGTANIGETQVKDHILIVEDAKRFLTSKCTHEVLSIQYAQSGSISEVNSTAYALELYNVSDSTVLFPDRPNRIATYSSTSEFVGNWTTDSITVDTPDSALIVEDIQSGQLETAVIELFDPVYDQIANTLSYTIMAENTTSIDLLGEFGMTALVIGTTNNTRL
ncbi:MAG: pentapeptide repeat-containing protein [Nitrososphaeraceae archaeon]